MAKRGPAKEVSPKNDPVDSVRVVPAWHLFLEDGHLSDFQVAFKDQVPAAKTEIEVDKINLSITQLGTAKGEAGNFKLDLRFAKRGQIALKGAVSLAPLSADFAVNLGKFPLKTFQPYLGEYLDLVLVKGDVRLVGDFSFRAGDCCGFLS